MKARLTQFVKINVINSTVLKVTRRAPYSWLSHKIMQTILLELSHQSNSIRSWPKNRLRDFTKDHHPHRKIKDTTLYLNRDKMRKIFQCLNLWWESKRRTRLVIRIMVKKTWIQHHCYTQTIRVMITSTTCSTIQLNIKQHRPTLRPRLRSKMQLMLNKKIMVWIARPSNT